MQTKITLTVFAFFSVFLLSCGSSKFAPGKDQQTGVRAFGSADFLNSLGVNTAVSGRGESLDKTIEITNYLGIRWIRSGYEGDLPVRDLITLHNATGIQFSYGLLSGGNDIPRLLNGARRLAAAGASTFSFIPQKFLTFV